MTDKFIQINEHNLHVNFTDLTATDSSFEWTDCATELYVKSSILPIKSYFFYFYIQNDRFPHKINTNHYLWPGLAPGLSPV